MNTKSIGILAAATAAAAAAAFVTLRGRESAVASAEKQERLFPQLKQSINDAETITVERKDGAFTLQKQSDGWGLAEKSGYPVDLEPVRKTLLTLADMKTLEAKTSSPELYAKLGVEDPTAEGAKSSKITIKNGAGQELAQLVIGKNYESKNYGAPGESYVRKPGDKQSWLVEGQLDLKEKGADWLRKEILKVTRDRVRQVEIRHPDQELVHVERAKPEQNEFTLAAIPEGKELTYATVASTVASGLEYVNLDDVQPAGSIDFTKEPGPTATFWCFDGLKVTVQCKEQDGKTYAQFSAAFEEAPAVAGPEPAPADGEAKTDEPAKPAKKSPEEVKKEIDELNARLSKWTYVLSTYNRGAYYKRMSELVKDKAPPPPPPGTNPGGTAGGDSMKIPDNLPPEIQEAIKKDLESRGEKSEVVPAGTGSGGTPPTDSPAGGTPPSGNPPPSPPHR